MGWKRFDNDDAANYISGIMSFVPIIQEAWEHRRRRHQATAAAAVATVLAVALTVGFSSGGFGSSNPGSMPAISVAPSTVLAGAPYMGVNCPIANSIACDRVGLAVTLKQPATSMTATIAGAKLPMDYRGDVRYRGESPRTEFDGFLQPAGIVSTFHVKPVAGTVVYTSHGHVRVVIRHHMWFGNVRDYPAGVPVLLTIHQPGGRTLVTHTNVDLSTGWG